MEYSSKSKDITSNQLIQFFSSIPLRSWKILDYIIIFGPLLSTLFISFIIQTQIVVILIGIALFSISMILYSIKILRRILDKDIGNERMVEIADAIREGSEGFFMTQYSAIFKLSIIFGIVIFIFYLGRNLSSKDEDYITNTIGQNMVALCIVASFFLGAFCSAFAGYSGMWVSVRTNIRVAAAAIRCYNDALVTCFDGGLFASIINIALAIFGICVNFLGVYFILFFMSNDGADVAYEKIPLLLVGFSFGASFVAMFAQLGGGIYTKAADVGADLIGKIEMGIGEDDARNPAVIADLVGDNVGDCAGQAADLFESISAEILSAMILGSALSEKVELNDFNMKSGFMTFPLLIHCLDLVVSIIGSWFVKTKPGLPVGGSNYQDVEDPLEVMKRGYRIAVLLGNTIYSFRNCWNIRTFVFLPECKCLVYANNQGNLQRLARPEELNCKKHQLRVALLRLLCCDRPDR